ncbi:MAG: YkgJ family cysteine cluster protein [Spirochaetales bacterium]
MGCFYDKGLKFSCQGCRVCCSVDPGFVFLSEDDIQRMADGLSMERQAFIDTYCRIVDMGQMKMISLLEKENYDCIFLTDKGCKVYPYRPVQCATYPFWAHILENKDAWNEEAKTCPGMNKGQLHSKEEIDKILETRLSNTPVVLI